MEVIGSLLSVNTIMFEWLGYPMSYIEFIGTVLYVLSVWLIAQKNMLTWPIGIASVILYAILFYQIQLYSDAIEQIYYLGASVYGWLFWTKQESGSTSAEFKYSNYRSLVGWLVGTILVGVATGILMSNVHEMLPSVFSIPASFPFVDALTTIASFSAMFLLARQRVESWIYWIVIDVAGIILYFIKDVRFLSLLYAVLLIMAIRGLYKWHMETDRAQTKSKMR